MALMSAANGKDQQDLASILDDSDDDFQYEAVDIARYWPRGRRGKQRKGGRMSLDWSKIAHRHVNTTLLRKLVSLLTFKVRNEAMLITLLPVWLHFLSGTRAWCLGPRWPLSFLQYWCRECFHSSVVFPFFSVWSKE